MKKRCERDQVRGQRNFIMYICLFLDCCLLFEYVVEIVQLKVLLPLDLR